LELINLLDQIGKRNEELLIKEQAEGLTPDEIEDAQTLSEWLDELATIEVTDTEKASASTLA